jgi:hypothetical protein
MNINIIDPENFDSDELIRRAKELNKISINSGIDNIFQPGLVKEIIIAKILGHNVVTNKRMPDACSKQDNSIFYEYLSCYEGGSGQLDRMFKFPPAKREESLKRITRNAMIYFAIFFRKTLTVKAIYEIKVNVLLEEAERQLNRSNNDISHVGFSENWAERNCKKVYFVE